MAKSCRLIPVVRKREGTRIVEKSSKLFKDIKEAVIDNDTAWRMWAFTKTPEFKEKYQNDVEYDDLGEVTFKSLLEVLHLKDVYDSQKTIANVSKDYGFLNTVFNNPETAISKVNDFNSKEKKFVSVLHKVDNGYMVEVLPRIAENVEAAREQSYNNALTKEIIDLLRSIGFDVSWVSNPRYEGLFDPENATLHDGLITIIKIAKGELGEQALPEEFSHLIIEGLINHPLVQRLLNSLNDDQIKEILGESYNSYYEQYNEDSIKMKKEAAGKLLADYIKKKGTISSTEPTYKKKNFLSRIWSWAKGLFSKITGKQLNNARDRASDAIAGIYQLISSGDAVPLIDKHSILSSQTLYKLDESINAIDKLANAALTVSAKKYRMEQRRSNSNKATKEAREALQKATEQYESSKYIESLVTILNEAQRQMTSIQKKIKQTEKEQAQEGNINDIKKINDLGKIVREIEELVGGYADIMDNIATLDDPEIVKGLPKIEVDGKIVALSEEMGKILSSTANECRKALNHLSKFAAVTKKNIVYNAARTVYSEDKVRGIGTKRNEIMSLHMILDHASRDINYVDRWISAMSDADDALLPIIDRLVKQQKYERDMEMIEWNAQIATADEKLRKAGFSTDFMFERDKDGVPTGRIISQYDWDTYNKELSEYNRHLHEDLGLDNIKCKKRLSRWKGGAVKVDGERRMRLIKVYVNPAYEKLQKEGNEDMIPEDAIYEEVPNPIVYPKNRDKIENLAPAQKEYYNKMLEIKRLMMNRIPHRGQGIYKAVYISKDLVEGVLDNSTSSPLKAVLENYKKKFIRRPDDIGFGASENFPADVQAILEKEKDPMKAAKEIIQTLADQTEDDILTAIDPYKLKKIIQNNQNDLKKATNDILEQIAAENFYEVDTDFVGHRIQRLPIYYTRRLRDWSMLSTDFSGSMVAYCAMATNYAKMNEVIDILEVTRDYAKERKVLENEGDKPLMSKFSALGKIYKSYVARAGAETNIAGRIDDYYKSVVYEERKEDEGSFGVLGKQLDTAKALDTIKDYTGLVGLGFNIFSTISNVTVGKIQQWIEAWGGEYFTFKDYAKAVHQYGSLIAGCVAEMNSPVKKNKLSLLIQQFDPMGDQFESYRNSAFNKNPVTRILGNNLLAYVGMNAGEHILHCQTMLAILNNVKLTDENTGKKVSLYDALIVKTDPEDGVTRLELDDKYNFYYERDLIDNKNNPQTNKNYGRPLRDENGKIQTEKIQLSSDSNALAQYIMRQKRRIRKINDSLNGAFSADDKGAIHRKALGRLVMQFRQWMPAHYMRRFARAHYDADLEQWREGFYISMWKIRNQMIKDLFKGKLEYAKLRSSLSEHEKANLRRANAEISMFLTLMALCRLGGRVKDRDRSWADKMALYQINRMKLEVGASMPFNSDFFDNILQLLQKPAAAINTFEKFERVLHIENIFDEVQTGRYQGWSEWQRDAVRAIPGVDQIVKATYFDDSMFSMFEND